MVIADFWGVKEMETWFNGVDKNSGEEDQGSKFKVFLLYQTFPTETTLEREFTYCMQTKNDARFSISEDWASMNQSTSDVVIYIFVGLKNFFKN